MGCLLGSLRDQLGAQLKLEHSRWQPGWLDRLGAGQASLSSRLVGLLSQWLRAPNEQKLPGFLRASPRIGTATVTWSKPSHKTWPGSREEKWHHLLTGRAERLPRVGRHCW